MNCVVYVVVLVLFVHAHVDVCDTEIVCYVEMMIDELCCLDDVYVSVCESCVYIVYN